MKLVLISVAFFLAIASAIPLPQEDGDEKPMPYEFQWQVSERDAKTDGAFFTQTEKKDVATPDRTEGEYRVWLPDGRLMIVSYYVDKDSGFVPTITFEDNYAPEWE